MLDQSPIKKQYTQIISPQQQKVGYRTLYKSKHRILTKLQSRHKISSQLKIHRKLNDYQREVQNTKAQKAGQDIKFSPLFDNNVDVLAHHVDQQYSNQQHRNYSSQQQLLQNLRYDYQTLINALIADVHEQIAKLNQKLSIDQRTIEQTYDTYNQQISCVLQQVVIDRETTTQVNQLIELFQQSINNPDNIIATFKEQSAQLCDILCDSLNQMHDNYLQCESYEGIFINGERSSLSDGLCDTSPFSSEIQGNAHNFYSEKQNLELFRNFNLNSLSQDNHKIFSSYKTPEAKYNASDSFNSHIDITPVNEQLQYEQFADECHWKEDMCMHNINQAFMRCYRELQQVKTNLMAQYRSICQLVNHDGEISVDNLIDITSIIPQA